MTSKHGGNIYQFAHQIGCLPEQVVDFSANINPQQALDWRTLPVSLSAYAEPDYYALKQALHQRYPLPTMADSEVFNGASSAIFALLKHLQPNDVVLYTPIYLEYEGVAQQLGCRVHKIDRFTQALLTEVPKNSTVIFVNPATPDGALNDLQDLLTHWQAANCTIVIDESFLDFCAIESVGKAIGNVKQLYIIKSLSKFYGCAGVRVGFISADTALIKALKSQEPAWKLSSFDMAYMQAALANTEFVHQTRTETLRLRQLLHEVLEQSGLFAQIYSGQANFLLARLANMDGYALQTHLAAARILIRVCDNFDGLDSHHVRFAVKDEQAISKLAQCLSHV
ncbi:MAG: aminotransferase class I/II-fold pyridoxal phosphate-dependent enzyme [Methylococcales bacterium]